MTKIEHGIKPQPSRVRAKYPFREMEITDSFLIECSSDEYNSVVNRITSAAASFKKSAGNGHKCFMTRSCEEGVRCWRIEDSPKNKKKTVNKK